MMALFVSLIWLFSRSFVLFYFFFICLSLTLKDYLWKISYFLCIERQIWNVFYFLLWTQLHSHTLQWYSAFKIQTKVKCQMSIPICDGHQLFSLFSFVLQLQHFPFSLHTFVKYSFHESHVWLCQIVFVLLVFTKKLYFGLCRFWQEIERLPCHAKVLSLLLKL